MSAKPRYTIHKYDDPTLDPSYKYFSALYNGFSLGIADTEEGAEKIISDHKKKWGRDAQQKETKG